MSYSEGLRPGTKTAPQSPYQVVQVVADVAVQNWTKQIAATWDQSKIPYKTSGSDLKQYNIYAGEILFGLKPSFYRDFGLSQPTGVRQAVLSSAVGLPAFTEDQDTSNYANDRERHNHSREKLEDYSIFWGVSEGNYYGHDGPEKSSAATGFTSMHSGVKTVVCFARQSLMPGTRVRMGFAHYDELNTGSSANYRNGPTMAYKATLVPVDGKSTFDFFKTHLTAFIESKKPAAGFVFVRNAANHGLSDLGFRGTAAQMHPNSAHVDTAKRDMHLKTFAKGLASAYVRIHSVLATAPNIGGGGGIPMADVLHNEITMYDAILTNMNRILDERAFIASAGLQLAQRQPYILDGVKPLCNAISQRVLDERPIGVVLREAAENVASDPIKTFDVLFYSPI